MLRDESEMLRAKRRRKALAWWMLPVFIWAVYAYKESKHEPTLALADSSTKTITTQHLQTESADFYLVIPEDVSE